MQLQIDEKVFYDMVKKAVSEAIEEKYEQLKFEFVPYVNDDEMTLINEQFGEKPNFGHQEFEEFKI